MFSLIGRVRIVLSDSRVYAAFLLCTSISSAGAEELHRSVPRKASETFLSFAPVAEKSTPAVVNVYATRMVPGRRFGAFDDHPFFHFFFEKHGFGIPRARVEAALGSGVLVSSDGVVVTNDHVVADAVEIRVALPDRREFAAKVMVRDQRTDLAVLRIVGPDEEFPFLQLGDSDDLHVGDLVLAIGNPFGVGQTVTFGIVSALARSGLGVSDYQSFIQTDAAINPGNSGGAMVDMAGSLIGINTAIFSRSGGSQGVGFAIPSNMVRLILGSLDNGGIVRRPWLGAKVQIVTADVAQALGMDRPVGVLVNEVTDESPAHRAGLQEGDVILSVAGRAILDVENFGYHFTTQGTVGDVEMEILRQSRKILLQVPLQPAPENPPRNETLLGGNHLLKDVTVLNLSPAVSEELRVYSHLEGKVVVKEVMQGTLAASIGLRRGDILLQINGKRIKDVQTLVTLLSRIPSSWKILIERDGQQLSIVFRD